MLMLNADQKEALIEKKLWMYIVFYLRLKFKALLCNPNTRNDVLLCHKHLKRDNSNWIWNLIVSPSLALSLSLPPAHF